MGCHHSPGDIPSFLACGVEVVNLDIRRVQNGDDMFGVRSPRPIICAALLFLSTLIISGHHLFSVRYHQGLAETMATTLKFLTIPSKGNHTATVIFMHVRRHRALSTSSPNTDFRVGTRRYWLRLGASRQTTLERS